MNSLKLKVVLLCFSFFCIGFFLASTDIFKSGFCKARASVEQYKLNQVDNNSDFTQETSGPLRVNTETVNKP